MSTRPRATKTTPTIPPPQPPARKTRAKQQTAASVLHVATQADKDAVFERFKACYMRMRADKDEALSEQTGARCRAAAESLLAQMVRQSDLSSSCH
jgi:hypothetical protein